VAQGVLDLAAQTRRSGRAPLRFVALRRATVDHALLTTCKLQLLSAQQAG